MHIAHLTTHHGPGDPRMVLKEAASSVAAGHRVSVVLASGDCGLPAGVRRSPGIEWNWVRGSGEAGRLNRLFKQRQAVVGVARRLKADVLHVHDPALLPAVPALVEEGERVVYDMHDVVPLQVPRKGWIPRPFRRLVAAAWGQLEQLWLRGVPVIFAEDSYAQYYPQIGPNIVIHNFARFEEIADLRAERTERPTVAYLGGVTEDRGVDVTLEALATLEAEGLALAWECIGPVCLETRDRVARWQERNPGVKVSMPGPMPQKDALRRVAKGWLGLAVLQPVPNYVESYPTKLFEYMAMGLPVVASDFPLYRSVVEDAGCGVCVDPTEPRALARAIRRLVENDGMAREMGERGREAVRQRYCWETEARRLDVFYHQIVSL